VLLEEEVEEEEEEEMKLALDPRQIH